MWFQHTIGAGGNVVIPTSPYYISTVSGPGNETVSSVEIDSNDNIIVAGRTDSYGSGSFDGFITKYDTTGNPVWQRIIGGASEETIDSVTVDSNDNIICCGSTRSEGNGLLDCLIVKYDSFGSLLWKKLLAELQMTLEMQS